MSRRGDAVVVSINHRLNVLGYFDLSAFGSEYANSGNAGMDDIIASLKWVQENIEKFGGDPKNVTVFGQSGGGAKVTTLLQMPAADGLFAKGINMSGVINDLMPKRGQSGKEIAEAVMEELGVSSVKELEKVPYAQLAAAYLKVRPTFQAQGKYSGGAPIPNEFYVGDPSDVGFRKESSNVALMVGSVNYRSIEQILDKKHASVVGKFGCKGYDTFGPFKLVGGIAKGHPDDKDIQNAVEFVKDL